jgi:hypothetical protein
MTVPSPSAMLDEAELAARLARLSLEQKVQLLTSSSRNLPLTAEVRVGGRPGDPA